MYVPASHTTMSVRQVPSRDSKTKTCLRCASQCSACAESTNNCSECVSGYYLKSTTCIACPSNCTACTNAADCTSCITSLMVIDGVCNCPKLTYFYDGTCVTKYALNMTASGTQCVCKDSAAHYIGGQCLPCPSLCVTCTKHVYCSSCVSRAVLINSSCLCSSGYFIDVLKCTACPPQCKTCAKASICTSCSTGYKLYSGVCCQTGNWWDGSACRPCSSGCGDCESLSACTVCPSGFVLIK